MPSQTDNTDLAALLEALDPDATLVQRHLWLYAVLQWVRGDAGDVQAAVNRVRQLLAAVQAAPGWLPRWHVWWQRFITGIDVPPLLADFGFAPRTAFVSEMVHRLRRKWLPITPETTDLSQLFNLLLPQPFDAQWLRALEPKLTSQLHAVLFAPVAMAHAGGHVATVVTSRPDAVVLPAGPAGLTHWQDTLLDAITYNASQIHAAGFAAEIRVRMTHDARTQRAFHDLPLVLDQLMHTLQQHGVHSAAAAHQAQALREQLQACRTAAGSVYDHLEQHGVSVGIVFMLRQLRERIVRINELLDCLFSQQPAHTTTRLIARLVIVGHERRSLRKLWQNNTHLTAAKIAERHAESGENYITRNARDWRTLFYHALGGGAGIGLAVWFKFVLAGLALSIFWAGFAAGLNYAIIFVLIQLLHWTVATKQPAVTAPAMAAKLKDMHQPNAVDAFVDEVTHLIRSQIAAITGNLVAVVPTVLLICWALQHLRGTPMIDPAYAIKTLHSLSVLGPTALFAAFTGVLLFASSIIAGWVENWFVFHRLDSSIAHHPRFRQWLGEARAGRWAAWWRTHISGLAANTSLGLLLGLAPAFAQFFGIGLEVRHVTLAAGQIAAAAWTTGAAVLHDGAFWLAIAGVALVGPLNLAVSFFMAFRTALAAHNVPTLDRRRIYAALRYRLWHAPGSFFFPPKGRAANASADAPTPPAPNPPEP